MERLPSSPGWPDLTSQGWQECSRTLHLWTQIVGKVRLALAPMTNHWWQVPLYVTARGLGTSLIPYDWRSFEVDFDLLSSLLQVRVSDGAMDGFALESGPVAAFHRRFFETLHRLGIEVEIHPLAVEIPETIHLDTDQAFRAYDPDWAQRFHASLVTADRLLKEFRAGFIGKVSPVHFFWGSFDIAVSRFSGARAPLHAGGAPHTADRVMQEAYSHEVSSAGFWPGGPDFPEAAYYSYVYPEPDGYPSAPVLPSYARYDSKMRIFLLPYERARSARFPDLEVKKFLETTYQAAAVLGGWPRKLLERQNEAEREEEPLQP